MLCRACWIVALVAWTGCKPEVGRVTGGTDSSSASSASSSSGAGGAGGDLPACIARLTTPDGLPDSSIDGGSWWLALFDGTGHLCAAKASHLLGLSPLLGGSSVVFRSGSIEDAVSGARSVIRRIQLSELAE